MKHEEIISDLIHKIEKFKTMFVNRVKNERIPSDRFSLEFYTDASSIILEFNENEYVLNHPEVYDEAHEIINHFETYLSSQSISPI